MPTLAAGLAVALGSTALSSVLRGDRWLWYVLTTVGLVVVLGQLARLVRLPALIVPVVQAAGVTLLLTGLFSTEATARVLPGSAALSELGQALGTALTQIEGGVPPVPTTMALALLVSLGYGVVATVVDACAAAGHAPAACGLVLLGAYTVPTALAPEELPDWSLAAGAVGYVLVLLAEHHRRQAKRGALRAPATGPGRRPPVTRGGGLVVLLTVVSIGAALGAGLLAEPVIGTHGRFAGGGHGDSGASDGQFGVNPFASLRGQLENDTPVELLRVSGLPSPQYLRSVTLTRYVPQRGWQAPDHFNGVPMDSSLPSGMGTPVNNPTATVTLRNIGYLDQWLPLYGQPMGVTGLVPGRWHYDVSTRTAYTDSPVREPTWTERAGLPDPPVSALEQSPPATDVNPTYLDTGGVDPRVSALAHAVTRRARSPFERAVALNRYFLDPAFGFRYSPRTRPGNSGDALVDFLTRGKTGYCEQFASAMAVMLRAVGVPARVAVGFSAGRQVGAYRTISTADAHAWVEAYFAGFGWLTFDPTPLDDGRGLQPDYVTNAPKIDIQVPPSVASPPSTQPSAPPTSDNPADQPGSPSPDGSSPGGPKGEQAAPTPSAGPSTGPSAGPSAGSTPTPEAGQPGESGAPGGSGAAGGPPSAGPGPGAASPSPGPGPGGTGPGGAGPGGAGGAGGSAGGSDHGAGAGEWQLGNLRLPLEVILGTALGVLALLALVFGPASLRGASRRRRLARAARGGPQGAVAAWREVLAEFRDRGAEPSGNDTVRATARRLARVYRLDATAIDGLKTVVGAVERGWYAANPDPGPGEALVSAVTAVRTGLARRAPLPLAARLWPRSALPGRRWWRRTKDRVRQRGRTVLGA